MFETVMLIHGARLTPRGWEFFRKRYAEVADDVIPLKPSGNVAPRRAPRAASAG
jgi:hypothetical protein